MYGSLPTYVYVPCLCLVPRRPEEGIESLGTGLIEGCGLPCQCWEANLHPIFLAPSFLFLKIYLFFFFFFNHFLLRFYFAGFVV